MSGIGDFFSNGEELSISAVDAAGDAAPVGARYSTQVLQRAASLGKHLVAGVAMGTALMAASPAEAAKAVGISDIPSPSAKVIKELVGPTGLQGLRNVVVSDDQLPRLENTSPMMVTKSVNMLQYDCLVSMHGMDQVIGMMQKDLARPGDRKIDPARVRQMFTIHEVAHCEWQGKISYEKGYQAPGIFSHQEAYFKAFNEDAASKFSPAKGLQTLTMERQADSKMLLVVARDLLGGATSDAQRAEGLKEFKEYADDMLTVRKLENRLVEERLGGRFFNDHDTVPALELVKKAVINAASSRESMEVFKKDFLGDEQLSDRAMQIAIGTVQLEALKLTGNLLKTTIDAQVDLLRNFADQLKALDADTAFAKLNPGLSAVAREQQIDNNRFAKVSLVETISSVDAEITGLEALRDGSGKGMQTWPKPESLSTQTRAAMTESVDLVKSIESAPQAPEVQARFGFHNLVKLLGQKQDRPALDAASTLSPVR